MLRLLNMFILLLVVVVATKPEKIIPDASVLIK